MTTWQDIKIFTLQKIFAVTGDSLVSNTATSPYLKSMPHVANEALQLLSTAGKYLVKNHDITQDGTGTTLMTRYDFNTLVTDFYSFRDVYFDDGEIYKKAIIQTEGDGIMVLPTATIGTWKVYYNAYPQQITKDTPDETELALDPEVVVLLPLYMASQLYKDDDMGYAVQWRNEFEVARELLMPNGDMGTVEFAVQGMEWY